MRLALMLASMKPVTSPLLPISVKLQHDPCHSVLCSSGVPQAPAWQAVAAEGP